MAITEYAQSALSVSTTELSLVSGTSTLQAVTADCVLALFIDTTNMAKGDVFVVKIKEKVISGGTQRVIHTIILAHAQSEALWLTGVGPLIHGCDVTIIRSAGSDRAFDTSVRLTPIP